MYLLYLLRQFKAFLRRDHCQQANAKDRQKIPEFVPDMTIFRHIPLFSPKGFPVRVLDGEEYNPGTL